MVDNDETGSAAPVVEATPGVRHVVEGRPGIPAARNKALSESGGARLLVFIDDDECPSEGWLSSLVGCWLEHRPAGVAGPVRTEYPEGTDPWVVDGGFYDRLHARHLRTGDQVPRAATNNLLLDLDQVRRLGLRFDERFRASGGEDTVFTTQLHRADSVLVWCREAVVVEQLLPSRATRSAVLRRSYSLANSAVVVESWLADGPLARWRLRVRAACLGVLLVAAGGGQTVLGRLGRSDVRDAHGRRAMARGRGTLSALVGRRAVPYARLDRMPGA